MLNHPSLWIKLTPNLGVTERAAPDSTQTDHPQSQRPLGKADTRITEIEKETMPSSAFTL